MACPTSEHCNKSQLTLLHITLKQKFAYSISLIAELNFDEYIESILADPCALFEVQTRGVQASRSREQGTLNIQQ